MLSRRRIWQYCISRKSEFRIIQIYTWYMKKSQTLHVQLRCFDSNGLFNMCIICVQYDTLKPNVHPNKSMPNANHVFILFFVQIRSCYKAPVTNYRLGLYPTCFAFSHFLFYSKTSVMWGCHMCKIFQWTVRSGHLSANLALISKCSIFSEDKHIPRVSIDWKY